MNLIYERNATQLAEAWLNVSLFTGDDTSRPVIYRTVMVEVFGDGIQLIATDSFTLCGAWLPNLAAKRPAVTDKPTAIHVVVDDHALVHRLMAQALCRPLSTEAMAVGIDDKIATFMVGGVSVSVPLIDADVPDWRARSVWPTERTSLPNVHLNPSFLSRFGNLRGIDARAIKLSFTKDEISPVLFEIKALDSELFGVIMPVKADQ